MDKWVCFKRYQLGCLFLLAAPFFSFGQPLFLNKLAKGVPQHIVVYGTSLSSGQNGKNWMEPVKDRLEEVYGKSLVSYTLAGKGGKWSTWGVQHLQDSVLKKNPDVVLMEFGMNDAFRDYKTSVATARENLINMIKRIRSHNPHCEIILQVMNMPIGKSASYRPNLTAYYEMYRAVAKELNTGLIDHYDNWQAVLNQGEEAFRAYVPDGLHPNEKGNREIVAANILAVWGLAD